MWKKIYVQGIKIFGDINKGGVTNMGGVIKSKYMVFEFEIQLNPNFDRSKQLPDPTSLDSSYHYISLNPSYDEFLANASLSIFDLGCRIRRIRRIDHFFVLKQTRTSTVPPETILNNQLRIFGRTSCYIIQKKLCGFQTLGDII